MSNLVWLGLVASFTIIAGFVKQTNACQEPPESQSSVFEEGEKTIWEFGMRVDANGDIQGITTTCPIPVDWPEQSIEMIAEQKSETVTRVDYDELPQNVRRLIVKINGLGTGQFAEAIVRVRVAKKNIVSPSEPDKLRFAKPVVGKLKPFIQPSPNIESHDKRVKEFTATIPVDSSLPAWRQVESIYDWLREHIEYEFDPKIRTCREAIERGKGDCEELASLFIAVCRIKQIPARAVWIPEHTYPEFYLEDSEGNGHWFPCQLAGTRQFGEMIESRPILQKGDKFRLPGNSETTRYVVPTLTAVDAKVNPKLSWISRQVDENPEQGDGKVK